MLAGCLAALALVVGRTGHNAADPLAAPLRTGRLAGCIAFAAGLLLLGGETHLFFATRDWLIRDAVHVVAAVHPRGAPARDTV